MGVGVEAVVDAAVSGNGDHGALRALSKRLLLAEDEKGRSQGRQVSPTTQPGVQAK